MTKNKVAPFYLVHGVCVCVRDFEIKYLGNQGRYGVSYYWEPIGKWPRAVEW